MHITLAMANILYIDQELCYHTTFETLAKKAFVGSISVQHAYSLDEGLGLYEASLDHGKTVDAIFVDVPCRESTAVSELRKSAPHLPIILVSSNMGKLLPEDRRNASVLLEKPYAYKDVRIICRALLPKGFVYN